MNELPLEIDVLSVKRLRDYWRSFFVARCAESDEYATAKLIMLC